MPVDFSSLSSCPPSASDLERDVKLLADVCREYVTQSDTGWRNEVARHPDPERLASTADQHGVLPLMARAISLAGVRGETVQTSARGIAFHNLALAAELVKLIRGLRELGIEALAYKGAVLAQQLYGDVTLRQFRDLDILIAPMDVMLAREALCQLGYEEFERFSGPFLRKHVSSQCEWQMRGKDSGTTIELHWALFPRYASIDLSVTELTQESVSIEVAGERVKTMNLHHLVLVLSAHGTKHLWYRLEWLVDFALALQKCGDDGGKLLENSARKGMKRTLLISAALAANVLHVRLPKEFESALRADDSVGVLADDMLRSLVAGVVPADLLGENVLLLRARERWSDRAKIVSRLAITPGPEEWRWVDLPEWAEWFYRPIRLARAARYLPRIVQRTFSSRGGFGRKVN